MHPIHHQKGNTMYTTTQSIQAEIARTQAQLTELQRKLAEAENPYGEEPKSGTVLRFTMKYDTYGQWYDFVVLRVGGFWYPSGSLGTKGNKRRTWESLCADWKTYRVQPQGIIVLVNDRYLR